MEFFNQFETQAKYDLYFKSENYTEPHLALIEENGKLYYKKETPLQLSYNARERDWSFINNSLNIKTLKIDGTTQKFNPIQTIAETFVVDSEKISFKNDETCNAPQEYFKYKNADTIILKPSFEEDIEGFDGFVYIHDEDGTYTYQLISFDYLDDDLGVEFTFDTENNTFSTSQAWDFISQFNNLKNQLQNKLNVAKGNSFIDDSVLTNLQNRLNNISTNTPEKEFNELRNAINNLGSADSGIVRLQNAITRLQERISVIKKNKIDIVDPSDIAELRQAENEVSNLKNLLGQLKAGDVIEY